MKLIWHIVLKDLARLRLWLTLWVTLYFLQVGLGFGLLYGDGTNLDWPVWLQLASAALVLLQVVAGLIAICRLVHEDRLVGTDMGWRTRPVSPARLLAAKLLGAGLGFALLPVMIMVPWWLACGFEWPELWRAALSALGWQVVIIIPAFWLASLTDTIGRFLLWLLVGVIALITVMLTLVFTASPTDPALTLSRIWAAVVIALGTGLGVTVHRFLARRFATSVVYSLVGLSAAILALVFWPWVGWGGGVTRPAEPAGTMPTDAITMTLGPADAGAARKKDSTSDVLVRFAFSDVPETAGIVGLRVDHTWTWPDGLVVARNDRFGPDWSFNGMPPRLGPALGLPEPVPDPETEAWLRQALSARPRGHPPGAVSDRRVRSVRSILPASVVQRIGSEQPRYAARVEAVLTRVEPLFEFPLADRSVHRCEGQTLRVTELQPAGTDRVEMTSVITTPAWQAGWRQSLNRLIGTLRIDANNSPFELTPVDTLLLANRTTGELCLPNGRGRSVAQICGVTISWSQMRALAPKVRRGDAWVVRDPQWFGSVNLCVVRARGIARLSREVQVDHFELSPRPHRAAPQEIDLQVWWTP